MVHVPPDVAGERAVTLKTRLQLAVLNFVAVAAGVLPRHTVAEPLCRLAGGLWYLGAPAARAAVQANLRHILGREPTRRQVVAVFANGVLNYWDIFAIPHLSRDTLLGLMDIRGLEHVDAARAAGHGVVAATAHLGSVSLVGQLLPALGYETLGLLEPIQPPELYEFFARQRNAGGVRLLQVGPAALRELLEGLKRNAILGIVTDRDIDGHGPMVPFFDAPTRFPDGVAALSLRTGAPILVAIPTRLPDGRFIALFEPLPPVALTGDRKADLRLLTQAVARRLEYHIASHPEQWTVFQKRWPDAQPR
ncbi:MAG TPA: lysophospholipid acyltransferase family protein [Chloroflexota bacterium]|nr:lysophospholipid acyltransferase family protein [Chloroflexota bacterium]